MRERVATITDMAKPGHEEDAEPPAGRMHPVTSLIWAFVPLYTIGFGTCAVVGWAAYRLRNAWLAACSLLSVLMMIGGLAVPESNALGGTLILVGPIGCGLALTFGTRSKFTRPTGPAQSAAPRAEQVPEDHVDPALHAALARRERRAEARRILETDPALADELHIGRPDLPREYDDGGILDMNHVPAYAIASLPGFTAGLAEHVVRVREEYGGFTLLSELVVYAHVPEELAKRLADRLVFLP